MSSKNNSAKKETTDKKDDKSKANKLKKFNTAGVSEIVSVNRWWEKENDSENEDSEKKWKTLEHNGVIFPPPYEQHHVKILYKNHAVSLEPEQEELATFWAGLLENDLSRKETVQKNFFKDFKESMGKEYEDSQFTDFDFSPILDHLNKVRERNRNKTAEEKKVEKDKKQAMYDQYGFALVDQVSEKISNYLVEPPGIFRGRGEHPLAGRIKKRIYPEDVTLNLGQDNPIPKCTVKGHSWGDIVNNDEATWLASFKENTENGNIKYVFLASNSKFKGLNDMKKYEKARKLKDMIQSIREDYNKQLTSDNEEKRQLGVATYLIDKLALRVGNEKKEDEADTVGCCSLRVEHIIFEEDSYITLDFLGKDSMKYHNTVKVDPKVYENLRRFVKGKKPDMDLFDLINASKLNDYLKSLMDGLSAKVFRTYNASVTLQKELDKSTFSDDDEVEPKKTFYDEANKQVAILCNHQKTVSKSFNTQTEKMQDFLKEHLDYLSELKEHIQTFGAKSKKKQKSDEEKSSKKANGKENEKDSKQKKNALKKVFPDSLEATEKAIKSLTSKIEKLESKMKSREELKEIALGTSKLNYMDPRITVSWCKKNEVPIEKVFTKSVRDKFPWAMYVDPEYKF